MATWIDFVLAATTIWLAWMALGSRDLFRSVVFYIIFGLVVSLAWVRLGAPDIALAEAAIGAGLTGALLIDSIQQLGRQNAGEREASVRTPWTALLFVAATGGMLIWAVASIPATPGGVTQLIAENIPLSGVEHPVTAVLLNFRSLDTWMEVFVLLMAVVALLIVRRAHDVTEIDVPQSGDPVLAGLVRVVVPLMVLAAGYLLWLGTHAPGGAFQAGAVLASAGVLLLLAGHRSMTALRGRMLWLTMLPGVLAFLVAATVTMLSGLNMMELSPEHAGTVIVVIEVAVTISIGVALAAMFAGAREPWPRPSGEVGVEAL